MPVWELIGYNTDSRYDDVRHREYTQSEKRADAFAQIPKIQFTDSGHGIVFAAREHSGKRKPTVNLSYVGEQLALMDAPWQIKNYIRKLQENHASTLDHIERAKTKREEFYKEIAESNIQLSQDNVRLTGENETLKKRVDTLLDQIRDNGGLGRTFV